MPETALVYYEWRRLVVSHEVRGAKVHDARLVAIMRSYGIRRLVTLNDADFRRYPEVIAVTPSALIRA